MNTKKLFAAFALTAAVGVVAGILFAPEKGLLTRKRLRRKGTETVESITGTFADVSEAFSDGYEQLRRK